MSENQHHFDNLRMRILVQEEELGIVSKLGLAPYRDGNQWCILWGRNLQEGVCGFGKTPEQAVFAFNRAYTGEEVEYLKARNS